MKKYIIIFIFAILVGSVFAFVMFKNSNKDIENVMKENESYTAFQLGVFKEYKNALEKKEDYKNSVIVKEDDYYRVYYSVLKNKASILKMENYLKENNINFYKKNIIVDNNDFINISKNFEKILINTDSEKVFLSTNNKILKEYKNV